LKHKELLRDPEAGRWYANVKRGSKVTADVYLRRLGLFCRRWKLTPTNLLSHEPKVIYNMLLDTVTELEAKNYAGSYGQGIVKAVRSWLTFNDIALGERKIRYTNPTDTPTLRDEKAPEPHLLRKAFEYADTRTKAAMGFMGFSGFRPEVLGNHDASDGLEVRDLPEIRIDREKKTVGFTRIPTKVTVRSPLNKGTTRHQYYGLLIEEGCRYLAEELERRLRLGHELGPNSPLIANFASEKERHITTKAVEADIRAAFRKAGFDWRPYILRVYFANRMMLAETKVRGLIKDYRVFFMGHKGDMEHVYTLNKCTLPESLEEDIRDVFMRASKYLETIPRPEEQSQLAELREMLLLTVGYTDQELAELDLAELSTEELRKLLSQPHSAGRNGDRTNANANPNGKARQRVVDSLEAKELINSGRYVHVDNSYNGRPRDFDNSIRRCGNCSCYRHDTREAES